VLTLNPAVLPGGVVGVPYSQQLQVTATNYTPNIGAFFYTGTLPPGLTLYVSGWLDGTPSKAGRYEFTITAYDKLFTAERQYAMLIASHFQFVPLVRK
jgi:hypothetical protein